MSGKKAFLKYPNINTIFTQRRKHVDLNLYFQTLQYIGMFATFIALVLIFLYIYSGKEEQKE